MSETKNKEANSDNRVLSKEEKVEMLKAIFSTLEVDKKAIFAQWCHEEIEKGTGELLGEKMQKMENQMNSFIAKATDKCKTAGIKLYNETNEAFKFASEEEIDVPNNHTSKSNGIWD